jgi:KRAB domain-containing zinc finger protein
MQSFTLISGRTEIATDNDSYSCCNCDEGIRIQVEIVNHLLSHFPWPHQPEPEVKIEDVDKTTFFIHEVGSKVSRDSEEVRKSKPSYHRQYNKRERSPETELLLQEFTQCHETKMFYCNFCRNGYKQKQTLERHLLREHDPRTNKSAEAEAANPENMFYCSICRNAYKHKQTIERHLLKKHNVVVEKSRLKRTAKPESSIKSDKFQCDKCGNRYMFRESLRKHLLRHLHPTNYGKVGKVSREKIICDRCSKLVDPSCMKRHFQVHHSTERPFKCDFPGCSTSFFDIGKFNDHKNIHQGIKPYICEYCGEF